MIIHFTPDYHFTSLHFTYLPLTSHLFSSLTIFHFPALLDVSSPHFKTKWGLRSSGMLLRYDCYYRPFGTACRSHFQGQAFQRIWDG